MRSSYKSRHPGWMQKPLAYPAVSPVTLPNRLTIYRAFPVILPP